MPKESAGILMMKKVSDEPVFFIVHPGGPLWKNKNEGAWSIPKGEIAEGEDALSVAKREFAEETGQVFPGKIIRRLNSIIQKGGKTVHAWLAEGELDAGVINSNTFTMEWPPRSGRQQEYPEIDRAGWFPASECRKLINPAQIGLIDEAVEAVK